MASSPPMATRRMKKLTATGVTDSRIFLLTIDHERPQRGHDERGDDPECVRARGGSPKAQTESIVSGGVHRPGLSLYPLQVYSRQRRYPCAGRRVEDHEDVCRQDQARGRPRRHHQARGGRLATPSSHAAGDGPRRGRGDQARRRRGHRERGHAAGPHRGRRSRRHHGSRPHGPLGDPRRAHRVRPHSRRRHHRGGHAVRPRGRRARVTPARSRCRRSAPAPAAFPLYQCASIMVAETVAYLKEHPSTALRHVMFAVYDDAASAAFQHALAGITRLRSAPARRRGSHVPLATSAVDPHRAGARRPAARRRGGRGPSPRAVPACPTPSASCSSASPSAWSRTVDAVSLSSRPRLLRLPARAAVRGRLRPRGAAPA